jgi:hypothetical protein
VRCTLSREGNVSSGGRQSLAGRAVLVVVLVLLVIVATGSASTVVNPFAGDWSTFAGAGTLNLQVVGATKGKPAVAYYSDGAASCVSQTVYYTGSYTASGDSGQIAGCSDATGRHLDAWYKSVLLDRHGSIAIDAGAGDTSFFGTYREASDNTSGKYDGSFTRDFAGSGRGSASSEEIDAALRRLEEPDMHTALTLYGRIAADALKHRAERWQIIQKTNTAIFQIQEDITINRARTLDKAFQKWDEYIHGEREIATTAAGQPPPVGTGSVLCKSARCVIVVTPTPYGQKLISQRKPFAIQIVITDTVPGYSPKLTVKRAWKIAA